MLGTDWLRHLVVIFLMVFCRFFFFFGGGESEVLEGRRFLEDFLRDIWWSKIILESIKGFRRIMNFLVQIKKTRHFCIYNIPYIYPIYFI